MLVVFAAVDSARTQPTGTETDGQTERKRERKKIQKNRKSNGQTENWIDRQEYRKTHTQTDRQIDEQNTQKNRQKDIINTDRMMERQTYIQKYRHTDMKRWNDKHTYEQSPLYHR